MIFIVLLFISSFSEDTYACESNCVFENTWAVGLGIGLGNYSNPLHDGKDRSLSALPSFYYYGEKLYIENTEIGYVLEENNNWLISLKGKFNNDGLYFNESAFDSLIISGLLGPGNFGEPDKVSVNEVDRDYSYLAGLSSKYFLNDNIRFSLAAYHDVTGVHDGYSITGGTDFIWFRDSWSFQAGVAIEFFDSDLNNYYYGLREEDGTSYLEVKLGSNSNISASAHFAYRLNENFSIIASYSYQKLGSAMTISPLVEDHHATIFFIGISGQYGSD